MGAGVAAGVVVVGPFEVPIHMNFIKTMFLFSLLFHNVKYVNRRIDDDNNDEDDAET